DGTMLAAVDYNNGYIYTSSAITGTGLPVVPSIVINSPIAKSTGNTIKWASSINWGTATVCSYSYDNFVTTNSVSCLSNGSDIPRPTAGEHTIYLRATDSHGGLTETAPLTFFYDNTSPVWTSCGADLLDEATRPYYYLTGNVTGSCTVTSSAATTTLKGNISPLVPGFTVTGGIIGNGHNLDISNITITSTASSTAANIKIQNATTSNVVVSGALVGQNAGNIIINNSVVGALIANGVNNGGGVGSNGGSITVATSTTGYMVSNGGNGSSNGGAGGTISSTNSLGSPTTSTITANGGNSTSCGNGGNSGLITLLYSAYGIITNNAGVGQNSGCPVPNTPVTGGQLFPPVIIGTYTPPGTGTGGTTGTTGTAPSFNGGGSIAPGFLNINTDNLGKLDLGKLPSVNLGGIGNNFGVSTFVNPLADLLQLKPIGTFAALPKINWSTNVDNFLNNSLPKSLVDLSGAVPSIRKELSSADIRSGYDLYSMKESPIDTPTLSDLAKDKTK
ncbi:MAG: hypothetical protein WCO97_12510, partial [bacterium]